MSRLSQALDLAARGLRVFPLRPGSKRPYAGETWPSVATTDPETIRRWFRDREDMNYGVCPGDDHVVIDLDVGADKDGLESFDDVCPDREKYRAYNTLQVRTAGGGLHLWYHVLSPAGNSRAGFASHPGIDVRGAGGYVVGPGSRVDGQEYVVEHVGTDGIADAPEWITKRLTQAGPGEGRAPDPLFDLDQDFAVQGAREYLRQRAPAVEGQGGDQHTYETAQGVIDFGVSEDTCLQLMQEEWNDRCDPPWDHGELATKVRNAWRYRQTPPGIRGGNLMESADLSEVRAAAPPEEVRSERSTLDEVCFRGAELFGRKQQREMLIPEWVPAHGMTAVLARRGGGKTIIMMDMALRIACDMSWHGSPVKKGMHVVYICGEDDVGAEEQARAWCVQHGREFPPDRFIFMSATADLTSADSVRTWSQYLHDKVGADERAAVFVDTWQRATARGGQNKDEDMQVAVHNAESLARALRGPTLVAFHPPKDGRNVILGHSTIENSTVAILGITDHSAGKKIEVTRMKGRGEGNYKILRMQEVKLGLRDEFGQERTGIVPDFWGGGSTGLMGTVDGDEEARRAYAGLVRGMTARREEEEMMTGHRQRPYNPSSMAEEIVAKILPAARAGEADWALPHLTALERSGVVNMTARTVREDLQKHLQQPFVFEDGEVLRVEAKGEGRSTRYEVRVTRA